MNTKYKKILTTTILLVSLMSFLVITSGLFDNLSVSNIKNPQKANQWYQETKKKSFFKLTEDWVITSHIQIKDQTILVNSNIIINSGGTLTLNNSTLVFVSSEFKNRIEVNIEGTLNLEGHSRITSSLSENNYYIKINRNSTFYSDNSEISYAGFAAGFDYTKSGVWINSDNVSINNTVFRENYMGAYLENAHNIEIYNATFSNNYIGAYLLQSSNIELLNCSITGSKNFGAVVAASENIRFSGALISGNEKQIWVKTSHNVAFYNNTTIENNEGLWFEDTSDISFQYNNITRNWDGINLRNCSQINIYDNIITQNNGFAIYLIASTNITLKRNTLEDNQHGISIEGCLFVNVSKNSLVHDNFIFINYTKDSFESINISSSNTVNALPLILIQNLNNTMIDNLIAGQLLIMFSNNISIAGIKTTIEIYETSNIAIENSTLSKGDYGTYMRHTQNVTLFNNTFKDNYVGVYLAFDNYTQVYNNTFNSNYYGIFHKKSNNTIAYMNFFLNNTRSIQDNTATFWDNGTIGNFWDDYTGIDKNNDGVGDSYYIIDEDSEDRFPIVLPDLLSPVVNRIKQYPKTPNELDDVTIEANITDNVGVKTVILSYSVNNITWTNSTMSYDTNKKLYISIINRYQNGNTVTYRIYACDYAENWVISEKHQYVVKYHELNPPTIQNIMQHPNQPTDKDYVKIEANITDDTNVSLVFLQYMIDSGVWHNVTMEYNHTTNLFAGIIPRYKASTNVTYRIYLSDVYNNSLLSASVSYTVLASDIDSPLFSEIKIIPTKPTELDDVIILANISDENEILNITLRYSTNNIIWQNITMHLNITIGLYQATIPKQSAKSEIFFYIVAQDLYGNIGVSTIHRYVVSSSDTKGPLIENVEYTPINPTENDSVKVTAQITDDTGISVVILRVYDGSTWKEIVMKYNTTTAKYEGSIPKMPLGATITFRIYANDTVGNTSNSQVYTYKIDGVKDRNAFDVAILILGGLAVTTSLGTIIVYALHYYNKKRETK